MNFRMRKTRPGRLDNYPDSIFFEKLRFQTVHTETQSGRFQILQVWRAFSKNVRQSWQISVDGRPKRRNKSAFSNSCGVVWTEPKCKNKATDAGHALRMPLNLD